MNIADDLKNAYEDGYEKGFNDGFEVGQRDVQPERQKGEWLANGDIHKECPFCGEDWDKYVFGEVLYTGELPKFCPNCGCRMESEEEV